MKISTFSLKLFLVVGFVLIILQIFYIRRDTKLKNPTFRSSDKFKKFKPSNYLNYAILAASVPDFSNDTNLADENGGSDTNPRTWGYIFQIPNTAKVWANLNYKVLVFILIDYKRIQPSAMTLFQVVQKELQDKNVRTIYVDVPSKLKLRLSQLLRLIPANLNILDEDAILTTSDADIWPVNPERYMLPDDKDIHITNSECCGHFSFKSKEYKMFPMTSIGMKSRLWKKVINVQKYFRNVEKMFYNYSDIKSFYGHLKYYADDLDIYKSGRHDDNLWYLDQKLVSIKIAEYAELKGWNEISFYPKFKCGRIDRVNMANLDLKKFTCVDDVHLPNERPWSKEPWGQLIPVIKFLFGENMLDRMTKYTLNFRRTYNQLNNINNT